MENGLVDGIYTQSKPFQHFQEATGNKGFVALAGPANKQARVAADNIAGDDSVYTGTQGSSILKVFDLTVAAYQRQ
ncbi:hypothetical protein [Acetobacterium bakii]|uniref:hypothetical protein n=1 Tax=Acetobacterium bakii TaxID=52689 RepID=UPI000681086B|nr:hypothetical protein [Acetobacterium bakii]